MGGAVETLEAKDFTRGFIAAMVIQGSTSLQPMNADHRRGLYRVFKYIEGQANEARASNIRDQLKALVRIRNRIAPGQTGAFDQFQTDLRDLQLSLTESPNPSYEDISFSLSKSFAQSLLDHLGGSNSRLVTEAAACFLRETENASERG